MKVLAASSFSFQRRKGVLLVLREHTCGWEMADRHPQLHLDGWVMNTFSVYVQVFSAVIYLLHVLIYSTPVHLKCHILFMITVILTVPV